MWHNYYGKSIDADVRRLLMSVSVARVVNPLIAVYE
jgi:hypothetical protein